MPSTTIAPTVTQVIVLAMPYKSNKFGDVEVAGPFPSFEAADEWITASIETGWIHPRSRFRSIQVRATP